MSSRRKRRRARQRAHPRAARGVPWWVFAALLLLALIVAIARIAG